MDISVVSVSSLSIANSAAVNMGVQLCFQDLDFNHLFLTFKKIEIQFISNVLISAVQQSDSVIHIHTFLWGWGSTSLVAQ